MCFWLLQRALWGFHAITIFLLPWPYQWPTRAHTLDGFPPRKVACAWECVCLLSFRFDFKALPAMYLMWAPSSRPLVLFSTTAVKITNSDAKPGVRKVASSFFLLFSFFALLYWACCESSRNEKKIIQTGRFYQHLFFCFFFYLQTRLQIYGSLGAPHLRIITF